METYKKDPLHPDAHPIHKAKFGRIVYNEDLLSPQQKFYQSRRIWRKEGMKQRRLEREKKEKEERESKGIQDEKEHMMYADKYAGITPHDLDGRFEKCTECLVPFWGTKWVYPLWQRCEEESRVLQKPYCVGCHRLFDVEGITMKDKIAIIRWLVTGKHDKIKENYDPVSNIRYEKIAGEMIERATRMRHLLYDHPNWQYLKSKTEINFEFRLAYPDATDQRIRYLVDQYVLYYPGIKVVRPTPTNQVDIATARELRDLVIRKGGVDAIAGFKCSPVRSSEIAISFDHIEPASKVRYRRGSYSIANLQILSRCLNRVKGNYQNKELARWLEQLRDSYEDRYID